MGSLILIGFYSGILNYDNYVTGSLNFVMLHFCDLAGQGEYLLNHFFVILLAKGLV